VKVNAHTARKPRQHIEDDPVHLAPELDGVGGVDEQDVVGLECRELGVVELRCSDSLNLL
jgi:hypothetical protein